MSADVVNLHAQVEAVLATLVKAATVELIKLFEGRHRASAWGPDATQRAGGEETSEITDSLWTGGAKRSVGVQVDPRDTCGMLILPVSELLCRERHGGGWGFTPPPTLLLCPERTRRVQECATILNPSPTSRRCPGPPIARGSFEGFQGAAAGGSEATDRCGFMGTRSTCGAPSGHILDCGWGGVAIV